MNNIFSPSNSFLSKIFSEINYGVFTDYLSHDSERVLNTCSQLNLESEVPSQYEKVKSFIRNIENNENMTNIDNDIKKSKDNSKSKNNSIFTINRTIPEPFLEKDIIHIICSKIETNKKFIYILNSPSNIQDIFVKKVKKEITDKIIKRNNKLIKEKKNKNKSGRKRKDDESIRIHNKYTPDNIINKIKNILKKYLLIFVNNIIFFLYDKEKIKEILTNLNLPKHISLSLIKDIDYKSISNQKKKKDNLALLNLSVRKLLSFNISGRYRIIFKNGNKNLFQYNKLIIDYLFTDENNRPIFNFIFNEINLDNWLDIFIHRKELNEFPQFNILDINQARIIEKSLVRIEDYFDELSEEGDIYFFCFILLIYNYKRYYLIKPEKNRRRNN